MRLVALCLALFPTAALAQGYGPRPSAPPLAAPPSPSPWGAAIPAPPSGAAAANAWIGPDAGQGAALPQQGAGGCYGCSYSGDYYGSNVTARRPAPPLRLQGQWRNGWWYY